MTRSITQIGFVCMLLQILTGCTLAQQVQRATPQLRPAATDSPPLMTAVTDDLTSPVPYYLPCTGSMLRVSQCPYGSYVGTDNIMVENLSGVSTLTPGKQPLGNGLGMCYDAEHGWSCGAGQSSKFDLNGWYGYPCKAWCASNPERYVRCDIWADDPEYYICAWCDESNGNTCDYWL